MAKVQIPGACTATLILAAILSAAGCGFDGGTKQDLPGEVIVEGIAANDKSGAQIETADKSVDLKGMRGWHPTVVGKKVRAKGILSCRSQTPPKVKDSEEMPQFRAGVIWALRDYTILEDGR